MSSCEYSRNNVDEIQTSIIGNMPVVVFLHGNIQLFPSLADTRVFFFPSSFVPMQIPFRRMRQAGTHTISYVLQKFVSFSLISMPFLLGKRCGKLSCFYAIALGEKTWKAMACFALGVTQRIF